MKNNLRYLVQGLLILAPVAITLWIIYTIISSVASIFQNFGLLFNPYLDPLIYFVVTLFIIYLVGRFSTSIFFRPLFSAFEHAIEKAPLIKIVYSSIKDFVSAFVGGKKRFNKPVLVTLDKANGIRQIGFITQENLSELKLGVNDIAVYMPFSYGFSGKLLIVPRENVTPIDIPSAEAMKFVVSGGVTDIDE